MIAVFVYCEIEEGMVADVSLELLTKGRTLANELGVKLEAVALGSDLKDVDKQVFPFGVDVLWIGDDKLPVSLHHPASYFNPCKLVQRRKTTDRLHGSFQHRT